MITYRNKTQSNHQSKLKNKNQPKGLVLNRHKTTGIIRDKKDTEQIHTHKSRYSNILTFMSIF